MSKRNTEWKKILDVIKAIGETLNSILPLVKALVIFASMFAVVLYIKDMNKQDELQHYINKSKQYEKEKQIALRMVDSVTKVTSTLEKEIKQMGINNKKVSDDIQVALKTTQQAKKQAEVYAIRLKDSTTTLIDSITLLKQIIPVKDTIIISQDRTIGLQQTRISNDSVTITKKDTMIVFYRLTSDSLQKVLNNQPKTPKNSNKLFGIIPLPSRRTAFIAGAMAGSIATLGAMKK